MGFHNRFFMLLISLIFYSMPVSAFIEDLSPYVGIDANRRCMLFKSGFGKNLFEKMAPEWSPYVGVQLNDCLSIEGGYQSSRKTKARIVSPGEQGLGFDLIDGIDPQVGSLYRETLRGWRMDIIGFAPVLETIPCLRFFGGVGLSRKRIWLQTNDIDEEGAPLPLRFVNSSKRTFTSKKSLLRLSVGVQTLLTDNMGVRAIVAWENTGRFGYLRALENPSGISVANLRNTYSLGLGFFVRF